MPLDGLGPDEVVAMRYDDATSGPDLAAWCGGQLGTDISTDIEAMGHEEVPSVHVPTANGVQRAHIGDWVVLDSNGAFCALSNTEFAARHRPA